MSALEPLVAALDAGGVVGVPTDTVYGIACRPDDAAALARVYAVKRRPPEMAVGLLAASAGQLEPLVEMPATARRLAAAFWPGGLSLVLAAIAGGGLAVPCPGGTLMVRVPGHPLLRELLRRTGPLAVTSANRHGEPACTTAAEVAERLAGELDALLDGGPGDGRGSTIIDLTEDPPRVLRTGPVSFDQLRPHLGG
ncbi:MAG TPA: L-threonylcarbamoyladenylate synthase [Candidatus Dormibacteraeota bacterium]|jgi:tRNA threonylcarbamoyl adenosine modification protein (Sua5/YciO/YrdC/YwlC family)